MNPQGSMTYERYDVGSTQPGVRHTAPNVDRVMGLAASQETTVDRLLTVVERLTAELATTQSALHDLALEVARAGIGGGGGAGQMPTVGYGTGVSTLSSGTVPLAPDHASHLPRRQADHAVISELASYSPEQHRAPATDGVGRPAPSQGGASYAPHDALAGVVPADPVDASPGTTPLDESASDAGFPTSNPQNGDGPHTEVATRPTPEQRAAADASAAAAASVAAAAAAAQTAGNAAQVAAQTVAAAPGAQDAPPRRDPSQPGPAATYGGPIAPPAPAAPDAAAVDPGAPRTDLVASLNDVQLLSAGAVDVMVGPVRDLADLDLLESRILALPSVEAVTVMAFEGRDVLVKIEIERPLPLASMLRTELGRPVESCRLVEGRIVVTFAEPEPTR